VIVDLVPPRTADLGGGLSVARLLPRRQRRMVGPWCFLDAYGPLPDGAPRMDVAPHPHIGLQTVSWLVGAPSSTATASAPSSSSPRARSAS
jgi:redox-sensitive bicupin YhaK (pirin superfamily)